MYGMNDTTTAQARAEARAKDRAQAVDTRIRELGVPKQELAAKAGVDRGTLARALKADPTISERTWVRIERVLSTLEDEYGMTAVQRQSLAMTASGDTGPEVQSTIEYAGARITMSGRADAVADAIRRVLSED